MELKRLMKWLRVLFIRLSLQWKIALSILFTFIIVLPAVSLSLFYSTSLLDRLTIVIDQDVKLGRSASEMSLTMLDIRRYERNYRMFGSDTERESVERLVAHAESLVIASRGIVPRSERDIINELANYLDIYSNSFMMLVEHISQNPPQTTESQRLRLSRRLNDFQTTYRNIITLLDKANTAERDSILYKAGRDIDAFSLDMLAITDNTGQPSYIQENLERSRQGFLDNAKVLGDRSWDNMQRHRMESLQVEARAKRNIISVLLVTGLICIFMIFYLPRYIVRPITSLNRVFKRAEGGDLKAFAPVVSNDEIGDLARSYNRMIERLSSFDSLKTQKIISQKRAFDRFLEALNIPACILTNDFIAVYYNAEFASLFGEHIPPKSPEGGLDIRQYESMGDFYDEVKQKLGEISNNIVVTFHGHSDVPIKMRGRIVRNALMKLESIVLIGFPED